MQLVFSFSDGRRTEAVLLAASTDRMRVAIPGQEDAVELRRAEGHWKTESGEHIELESIIADANLGK